MGLSELEITGVLLLNTSSHFADNGFALFEQQVLDPVLISESLCCATQVLNGHFDTGCAPWAILNANEPTKVQRIAQIHIASETLYQLVTSPTFAQLAAQVSGAQTVKIWGTQLYYKPENSGVGGVVGYHRDSEHMPYFASGAMTAWIPLNDFELSSGPLHFIATSHKWEKSNPFSGAQYQLLPQQQQQLQDFYNEYQWRETPSVLQAGNISFHHQDTLHGSPQNSSTLPRWALGVGLLIDDYQINVRENDFGFADILEDEFYCPTIYNAVANQRNS